ncbi:MAG: flagellar hook-associated protein FlgL [Thermodesulfobacteriota bacterium]
MKTTEGTTYRMLQTNLSRITNQLEDLRIQGATGIKLAKPSDDPAAIRPVLTTRSQIMHTDRYLETMGISLDVMQATDGHLEHVENVLQRVKEIAVNAINGSLNNEDRTVLANEVSHLKQELLDAANGMVDGKYIFAGYQENTKPFIANPNYNPDPAVPAPPPYDPADSTTWPYIYQGDANPTQLEITPGEFLEVDLTGNDLFLGVSNSNWVNEATAATGQPEPNRIDLFSVLTLTEEAIRTNNLDDPNPPPSGRGLQQQLTNLETAANQERRLRSQLGNRARRVETAMLHQTDVRIDLKQILSRYEDADAIETFNEIIKQETAFQAALNITSKVAKISILDFI